MRYTRSKAPFSACYVLTFILLTQNKSNKTKGWHESQLKNRLSRRPALPIRRFSSLLLSCTTTHDRALLYMTFFFPFLLFPQALDKIDLKKPITVSGGISATQTFYTAKGISARRDPYYWLLTGNLNFNLFGVISVPVSGQLSQQNKSYTQPFNQYGMSPTYKNWTGHFGYRSLQYSTYSLSGNQWLGGGIEYNGQETPIYASVFWGRLQKAVGAFEQEGVVMGETAYERYGYGSKIGYQKNGRQIALVLFRAKDNANSLDRALTDSLKKSPGENFVWAVTTKQPITKHINFDLEFATSAYTADSRNAREESSYFYINNLGDFFVTNNSTQVNKAIQGNIQYSRPKYQLKFAYRRIDPEYKTMGSIFLNNDIEDVSGGVTWKMFKQKVNINTTYGVQRNNLDKKLTQEMVRNAFAGNVSYAATKKLSFNSSYTNFLSDTKFNNQNITANQLNLNQNADSLKYNQITESASLGTSYSTGDSLHKHGLNLTGSLQKARDSKDNNSDFYSMNVGYNLGFVKAKVNINTTVLATYNEMAGQQNKSLGPNLGINKTIRKSWRLSYSVTYALNYLNNKNTGHTLNNRMGIAFRPAKGHSLSADVNWMNRVLKTKTASPKVSELRANLVYGYNF